MIPDVSSLQLRDTRKVSLSEYALIGVILVIATKFCTLPSVLTAAAGSKAVWVVLILLSLEFALLFFATQTARKGGLLALDLPSGARVPLLLLFAAFFTLKLAAFTREISTYFALSLFENAPVLPIAIILLVACSLLAKRGFAVLGRMTEIFVWLFLFVFLFVVIFTRTEGDLFNALGMFSPDLDGMGKGVYRGLAWYGDGAVVAFLDLGGAGGEKPLDLSPGRRKNRLKILFAAACTSFFLVLLFYAVFIAVYGDAAKMTDYAFIKLSAFKANTDELGSADWPVIILWSIVSCLYIALLLLSGKECLSGLTKSADRKKKNLFFVPLAIAAVAISTLFLDEEGDYESFMSRVMSVSAIIAAAAIVGTGIYTMIRRKGEENENQK